MAPPGPQYTRIDASGAPIRRRRPRRGGMLAARRPPRMKVAPLARLAACAAALAALSAPADPGPDPARADNWGRWGRDDQRGAANLITPERVVEAARLVQRGKVISLAIPLDASGPVFPPRIPPVRLMAGSGADSAAGRPIPAAG